MLQLLTKMFPRAGALYIYGWTFFTLQSLFKTCRTMPIKYDESACFYFSDPTTVSFLKSVMNSDFLDTLAKTLAMRIVSAIDFYLISKDMP